MTRENLLAALAEAVGPDNLFAGDADRRFYSHDLYSAGALCAAAIKPRDREALGRALRAIAEAGYAIVPRGGGLTYVGGYTPVREDTIVVDMSGLNRIIEVAESDMYITVEAGVTWKQIHDVLKPKGLRLPFFGTFSGYQATVGGGLSNGALFLGTGRYGAAADIVLGLEVALADGTFLRTGQAAFQGGKPFFRTYGPDLTGLFVHDSGALGLKTEATLRLIRAPREIGYLAFGFDKASDAIAAACEVSRAELAEDLFVMDPNKTRLNLSGGNVVSDMKVLKNVVAGAGIKAALDVALAGKRFADNVHSLNMVCAARSPAALEADLAEATAIAERFNGKPLPNSIPMANRTNLFPPPNAVLGPRGDRWVALNAKVAHSDSQALYDAAEAILARRAEDFAANGIIVSRLLTMMSNHAFSYEPVFNWLDSWTPQHTRAPEPAHLAKFQEPAENLKARTIVSDTRQELVELFARMGAASNQIGKTYAYLPSMKPETRAVLESLKRVVDREGRMNPGALGL